MEHDPTCRPKRFRGPVEAAYEVFQKVIGEKPCTSPAGRLQIAPSQEAF
jgi:hypothetical protein